MNPIWKVAGGGVLILAAYGSAQLALAITDRHPPIVYERARALEPNIHQGGQIEVEFSVFRLRICDGQVRRWLIDARGDRHAIPSFTVGPRPLAGLDTYRRSITVPEAAVPGPATYQVIIDYSCNFIHRLGWPIEVVSPPIGFEVTPRPLILMPPFVPPPDSDG